MQSRKQCALPVITTMALWKLMLGTWCMVMSCMSAWAATKCSKSKCMSCHKAHMHELYTWFYIHIVVLYDIWGVKLAKTQYLLVLYDIWGVKLAKTQYLPTSFLRRVLQGRRIYRFITIYELCWPSEKLTSYKLLYKQLCLQFLLQLWLCSYC